MEAVVLCGIQGSGKTTFYADRFLDTHVRVALDLLRTRAREAAFVRLCLETRQAFVVDNTNPAPADRRRYLEPARAAGFRVVACLVDAGGAEAVARDGARPRGRRVGAATVAATGRRLLAPTPEEGFDEVWYATAAPAGGWRVEPLATTPPLPGLRA